MNELIIKQLLDELAKAQNALALVGVSKGAAKATVLPAEIQQQLEDIDAEFDEQETAALLAVNEAQNRAKSSVLEYGASVKTELLHAVFSGGRVSWDAKALDGFAINHPELFAFRKEGKPSVSIRQVKRG